MTPESASLTAQISIAHPLGRDLRHPAGVLARMIDEIPVDAGHDDLLVALDTLARMASGLSLEASRPVWDAGAKLLANTFLTDRVVEAWQQRVLDVWMDRQDPEVSQVQR